MRFLNTQRGDEFRLKDDASCHVLCILLLYSAALSCCWEIQLDLCAVVGGLQRSQVSAHAAADVDALIARQQTRWRAAATPCTPVSNADVRVFALEPDLIFASSVVKGHDDCDVLGPEISQHLDSLKSSDYIVFYCVFLKFMIYIIFLIDIIYSISSVHAVFYCVFLKCIIHIIFCNLFY